MDLPTYTNIWRIEKRLYKLYDLRLPMPLPLVQIGVFLGIFVPWILLLRIVGIPFESPWHVLYIVPPGVLTWLATRPVIEGKRLTELLLSQGRYLAEPRTWCRLTPIREPREVVIVARVWRRADAPAPVAAVERAAIKSRRKRKAAAEPAAVPTPGLIALPSTAPAPPPLVQYAAQHDATAPAEPPKPWRRTTRDISHEDDVQPTPEHESPPATPQMEVPPSAPGSGKRALASGVRRPGAPAEFWQATPPATQAGGRDAGRPAPPGEGSDVGVAGREPGSEGPAIDTVAPAGAERPPPAQPRQDQAAGSHVPPPDPASTEAGAPQQAPDRAAGERPAARHGGPGRSKGEPRRDDPQQAAESAADERPAARHGEPGWSAGEARRDGTQESGAPGGHEPAAEERQRQRVSEGDGGSVPRPRPAGGEAGDKKVAGAKTSTPRSEPAAAQGAADDRGVRETRRESPRPWAPPQRGAGRPPATRPDIPMVPGAFGARPGEEAPAETPRMEAPRPWSEGLSKPRPASAEDPAWPASRETAPQPPRPPVQPPQPPTEPSWPPAEVPPAAEEQAPPREVRSQPASPVRPRPLPPPPAPPPSGPAITPPDPEHEVSGGGLRRLFHAVGGGHGDVDAEYQQRLQQPFHGTRHVVVLGCTGGAGQTVTSLMLGHTFAQHNEEPVVAIDVNPGPGALARRTRSDTNETLTGLITRADQVGSLTAMRRYTSQAKSGLDVIAAGKNPLQALDDRDYALAIRTIDRFYSVTLLDAAAAVVARVLPYADQIVLVAPASADAPRAVAMTFEWLDGHGYEELRSRAVTVINGVSRRSMDDVEQAEAVARGRCRALVRIPWDDHLSMDRAPRNELKSLRTPTRRAYLALAGVVAGGFTVMPERYQELQQEQEATR